MLGTSQLSKVVMKYPTLVCSFLLLICSACAGPSATAPNGTGPSNGGTGASGSPAADSGKLAPPGTGELERVTADLGEGRLQARLATTEGEIVCDLFEESAPLTVANFVGLARGMRGWLDPASDEIVERPLYDGVVFHRVIPGFAIQTGDPTGTGTGGPGYTFRDEFSPDARHDSAGVLSMANHGPNTNGSQFFITLAAAPHLDFRHTVFGKCEGLDVIEGIARSPTGPDDHPVDPPVLESVEIFRSVSGD